MRTLDSEELYAGTKLSLVGLVKTPVTLQALYLNYYMFATKSFMLMFLPYCWTVCFACINGVWEQNVLIIV